jgi:Flp pilus assembly protein TadB
VNQAGFSATLKRTAADVQRLAKLQADLAKQRIQAKARRKGIFAGMGALGTLFVFLSLLFLLAAATAGLALVVPVWLAILIMAGGLLLIGGVLLGVGAAGLRGSKKPSPVSASQSEGPWLPAKSS